MTLPQMRPEQTMTERYYDAFCAAAQTIMSRREYGRAWWALGIPPEVAGSWARHGFTPAEGWAAMNSDLTPEAAAAERDGGSR